MCTANASGQFQWITRDSLVPLLMTDSEVYEIVVRMSSQLVFSLSEKTFSAYLK